MVEKMCYRRDNIGKEPLKPSGSNLLDRFILLGQIKVSVQWKLTCLVHNPEKL
jgi:hypothetical protein